MDIQVNDIVTLKKPHPCGSRDWEVLRMGADFRLRPSVDDRAQQIGKERKTSQKKS